MKKKFRCKCITCGKGFFGKSKDSKYCSFTCVAKHNKPWEKARLIKRNKVKFVPCINCGMIFPTTSDKKICNTCEDLSSKLQEGQRIYC